MSISSPLGPSTEQNKTFTACHISPCINRIVLKLKIAITQTRKSKRQKKIVKTIKLSRWTFLRDPWLTSESITRAFHSMSEMSNENRAKTKDGMEWVTHHLIFPAHWVSWATRKKEAKSEAEMQIFREAHEKLISITIKFYFEFILSRECAPNVLGWKASSSSQHLSFCFQRPSYSIRQ